MKHRNLTVSTDRIKYGIKNEHPGFINNCLSPSITIKEQGELLKEFISVTKKLLSCDPQGVIRYVRDKGLVFRQAIIILNNSV